jgi:hypothetical protein
MVPDTAAATRFEAEVARYNAWREKLTGYVHAYHDWLEANKQLDVQQSIRFYDLLENLNKGRLMLAFLAEFSRGKSELINALFFSSFKERLLPSDVGRTTMCPTEIFHDPTEEPYLKLLSVETRYRDESITQLKNMPVEWSKVRLNVNSAADMKKTLSALTDTKKVYALEARMLGLAPMLNDKGELPGEEELVDVPAWRYAMINYPHPLLSNGLAVLDTPGLNALGMEPELTASTVPSAHAILFLTSIDTGVTKSDLEIWERYVRPGLPQKLAVLNKIDLMWDELKTAEEIQSAVERQIDTTAQLLKIPRDRIFPLSAQKALLGRVREDTALVQKSGIEKLERFLAEQIVPMKRQILCRAVVGEIGGMMKSSQLQISKKQDANEAEIVEIAGLQGKSREMITALWQKITAEKNAYNAALAQYKVNSANFNNKKTALMDLLNPQKLDAALAESATTIEESWTTVTLQRGMRQLVRVMSEDFEAVYNSSEDIKKLMQGVYNTFVQKFGFKRMTFPSLDLEVHHTKLKLLVNETDAFAKDPINVLGMEKSFLVKKFYRTLVHKARTLYTDARTQSERWVQSVQVPLETQMKDHKAQLQSRLDNLAKINAKSTSINEHMAHLRSKEADLKKQRDMIEGLIESVSEHEVPGGAPHEAMTPAEAEGGGPMIDLDLMATTKFDAEKTMIATAAAPAAARPAAQAPAPAVAPAAAPAAAPVPRPAAPAATPAPVASGSPALFSDDLMAEIGNVKPVETARTQPVGADKTQTLDLKLAPKDTAEDRTAALEKTVDFKNLPRPEPAHDSTVRMSASSPTSAPAFNPDSTQKLELVDDTRTVKLDDPIARLQEAKRLLKDSPQKA